MPSEELIAAPSSVTEVTRIKKQSLWSRLFSRKDKTPIVAQAAHVDEKAPESPPVDAQPQETVDSGLSATQLRREIAALRKEQKQLTADLADHKAAAQALTDKEAAFQDAQRKLADWHATYSATYVAKVQARMKKNLESAKLDMLAHEENVKNWKLLDEGTLLALRKAFHLGMAKTWRRSLFWFGLLLLLTHVKGPKGFTALAWLYNPVLSGPILVAIGIFIYFGTRLAKRFFKPERPVQQKPWWRLLVVIILWLSALGFLGATTDYVDQHVSPWLQTHFWEIFSAIATLAVVASLALLVRYYSGWSTFRRAVDTQVHQLKGVIEGYVATQQEIMRLGLLYPQTIEWIELIAKALYRPWKTDSDWGNSKEYSKQSDTFPHALRIAQAKESADANMVALENGIARRLLIQGWRRDAFEDLISEVAAEMGSNSETFNVELLDADLPHQSNNSRALISRYLDFSAGIKATGEVPKSTSGSPTTQLEPTDHYLVNVARKRLLNLIETTQAQILATAHPRVEQIIEDPLMELREDAAGVHGYDTTQGWKEFLGGALGVDAIETVAFGPLTFNVRGRKDNVGENPKTFVLAPKRLERDLPRIDTPELVEKVLLGDEKPRSVELMVRIDISAPVHNSNLRIVSDDSNDYVEEANASQIDSPMMFPERDL